jgi:hypothetical protein
MLTISLATACAVLTMHIYKQGQYRKPVPKLIKKIFFDYVAKLFLIKIEIRNKAEKKKNIADVAKSESSQQIGKKLESNHLFNKALNKANACCVEDINIYSTENEKNKNDLYNSLVVKGLINDQKKFAKLMKALNKHLNENEQKEELEEYYDEIQSEWAQLSKIVDVIFAFIFFSFAIFVTIIFIYLCVYY